MSTPILPFAVWASGTNQNSVPANDNALRAEIFQRNVNNATTAQPATPADGDSYIIQATHTGAQWSTFNPKDLAIFKGGTWYAFAPVEGNRVTVSGAVYVYSGGAWASSGGAGAVSSVNGQTGAVVLDLDDIDGVNVPAPIGGQVLTWDAATSTWIAANSTAGGSGAIQDYTWNTTTTTPPGTGTIRGNNATQSAITSLYVHFVTGSGVNIKTFLMARVATGDTLYLQDRDEAAKWNLYTVTAPPVDNTTYATIAVTHTAGGSALTGQQIIVSRESPSASTGMTNPMTTAGDLIVGGTSGTPGRLAAGTSTHVLTSNGAGVAPSWQAASGGGGGLTGFTSALNTASPNGTVNVSSITASGGTTNQDAAWVPKGTGAFLAQVPDNTSAGGNRRGQNAVDLQTVRSAATAVANGQNACIPGGSNNTASGTSSFAFGSSNEASGTYSIAMGGANTATLQNSVAIGASNNSTASYAVAIGRSLTANGNFCRIGGTQGTARGVTSVDVFGLNDGGAAGRYQRSTYVGYGQTTDATQKILTADGSTAGSTNQIVLPTAGAYTIKVLVVARKQGAAADSKHWELTLGAYRDTTAASAAIVGTVTSTVIAASAGASGWLLDAVADTSNGCISIRGTGAASTNIRWLFSAQTVEVEFP